MITTYGYHTNQGLNNNSKTLKNAYISSLFKMAAHIKCDNKSYIDSYITEK